MYGTLKRGHRNHRRFCDGAVSIEEAIVIGRLYELPSGIPVLDVPASDIIAAGTGDIAHDLSIRTDDAAQAEPRSCNSGWLAIRGELLVFDDPVPRLHAIDSL